jgi:hypothetical protein
MATEQVGIEGLSLLMTVADARAECARHGWSNDLGDEDARYGVSPGAPVDLISVKIEKGVIVSMEATYNTPQPARARAFGASLPIQREVDVLGTRSWAAFSDDRTVAVIGDAAGASVTAVHLGVLASAREVRALIETYGGGLAPPARA